MKKKIWIPLLCVMAGISTAGIGTTMAYYTDHAVQLNEVTFIGENGIAGILTEPEWDPDRAVLVLPNQSFPKDPQITNTSEGDLPIVTALEVQFVYGKEYPDTAKAGQPLSDTDMACVADVYQIDWNADNAEKEDWVRYEGQDAGNQTQCFYYKGVLQRNLPGKGDTTIPLFTTVSVPKEVNNKRYARIQEMKGFDIVIRGAVVQQMTGETEFGLNSAENAYKAGIFTFRDPEKN